MGIHDKSVRRTHPDIKKWESLSEIDQVKDLQQIVTIIDRLANECEAPNAFLPVRLVLTGINNLTQSQSKVCCQAITELVNCQLFQMQLKGGLR